MSLKLGIAGKFFPLGRSVRIMQMVRTTHEAGRQRINKARVFLREFWPQIVIAIVIGLMLGIAEIHGIIAEYGQDVHESSEAPTITHEAPVPKPWRIHDGD